MDESNDKYLQAAELVANCKPSKLPYVLAILKQGGFDITPETIEKAKENIGNREKYRRDLREELGTSKWVDTDDATCLTLRKLYEDGKSIDKISSVSGVHRTMLYKYIRGEKKPSKPTVNRINDALSKL